MLVGFKILGEIRTLNVYLLSGGWWVVGGVLFLSSLQFRAAHIPELHTAYGLAMLGIRICICFIFFFICNALIFQALLLSLGFFTRRGIGLKDKETVFFSEGILFIIETYVFITIQPSSNFKLSATLLPLSITIKNAI